MRLFDRLRLNFGTTRAAAEALRLKEQTVYKWGKRGIPMRHRLKVQRLLKEIDSRPNMTKGQP
jgi:hypothetical protein